MSVCSSAVICMSELKSGLRKVTPFQLITVSFLAVILLGSLLLSLPAATAGPGHCPWLDALFTSGSAVCVTGLVVQNTGTYWSAFGKTVILFLIQIGGLGVITVIITISTFTGRRIGLRQRDLMQNVVNAPKIGGIIRFTRFLFLFTFAAECVGAILLAPVFIRKFGFAEGIADAVFHSVSAFCNAGFDILDKKGTFASLTAYRSDTALNIVIMLLIVIGGLGFFTWRDLADKRFRWKRLLMQTRLIITVSAVLILLPAVLFFFFEYTEGGLRTRILTSLFQSVTTRTAGFNTAEIGSMHESGRLLMIILMLIGGSPASTAGGFKTTTAAVLVLSALTRARQKKEVGIFGRAVASNDVLNAYTLFMLYLAFFLTGSCLICTLEKLPVIDCMFECASALGTVGLSTGITPGLCAASKVILIFFMYFGRVGGLTLVYAALGSGRPEIGRLPEEHVMIG